VTKRAGQLVIIGGSEDRVGGTVILRRFRDLCGGENARIAVLGTATTIPDEVGDDYTKAFRAIGVGEVVFLPLASRDEANATETIEILDRVDGVFFPVAIRCASPRSSEGHGCMTGCTRSSTKAWSSPGPARGRQ
jgi:cyanophycinase-like exopeptidase